MSNASSLYMNQLAEKKKQFSTTTKINLIKIHFYNLASLAYFYK